jgi:hypothetical protein
MPNILFYDFDGFRNALGGRLPDQIMVFLRDFVKFDNGQQLVFIVFENLRAKFVAVAIAHALTVDAHLHFSLLYGLRGPAVDSTGHLSFKDLILEFG